MLPKQQNSSFNPARSEYVFRLTKFMKKPVLILKGIVRANCAIAKQFSEVEN